MSQPVVVLDRPDTREHVEHGTKTFTLELEILGEPVSLDLKVADSPARLSDLAPLARTISAKLALATSERLRTNGRCVTCRKGCSACCSYLVPLSVPEAFRIAEELPMMPAGENGTMIQSSLDACRTILDRVRLRLRNRPHHLLRCGITKADQRFRNVRGLVARDLIRVDQLFLSDVPTAN